MASDAELIGRSQAGDGQAFMEVISRHEGAVGAYLARRAGRYWRSRPAEDLVPDATSLASGWDPWPAVDTRVDTKAVLRAALARLRPEEREVLTLVAWEDLTAADAAPSRRDPRCSASRRHDHVALELACEVLSVAP
ncbi:MAG TPA: hypothetical protein VFV73_26435 [Streptosporangiaceae bacterium]|nr:hypothetical protein [Streptosporangiaceae bacterium]